MGQKVSSPKVRLEVAEVAEKHKRREDETPSWRRQRNQHLRPHSAMLSLGRYDSDGPEHQRKHRSFHPKKENLPIVSDQYRRPYSAMLPLPLSRYDSDGPEHQRKHRSFHLKKGNLPTVSGPEHQRKHRSLHLKRGNLHTLSESFLQQITMNTAECFSTVFQEEILRAFANFTEFKKFAQSEFGLWLNEHDLQDIFTEYKDDEVKQQVLILNKWEEKHGKGATVSMFRSLLRRYIIEERRKDKSYHGESSSTTARKEIRTSFSNIVKPTDTQQGKTPSCQSKSVIIQVKKKDCTLSNDKIIEIENIIKLNSEIDKIEFCDCKIGNDYCTPCESRKNTAKCKISKLIISYTDHFKEFSRFLYSTFAGCEIKSLCLVYANLDDQDVENLQRFITTKQVKGIENLDISYNMRIGPAGFEQIGNIIAEQGIKTLKVIDCDLGKMKLKKLFEGLKHANLRELDIGYNYNLAENGFEMLAKLVVSRGIEILKLRGCQLTEKTIQVFYNKLERTDEKVLLNELDVSYNPEMNPAGCEILGLIIKKSGVTTLNLAGCGISEEHLTSLMSMNDIELHALNLRDNSYPGNIIIEIANIVSEFKIQELDISDCMFSVNELRNFRTILKKTKLQKLHLGDKSCELDMEYIVVVCQLLQTVNEMLYLQFHRLDNFCRHLLNKQSEKLSVSIQLCDEPHVTSDK